MSVIFPFEKEMSQVNGSDIKIGFVYQNIFHQNGSDVDVRTSIYN